MSTAQSPQARTASHRRYLQRAREREEPTRTKMIRAKYGQKLRGRWDAIRAALRERVVERDAFGLDVDALAVDPPSRREFRFQRDADKIEAFREWLASVVEAEILQRFGPENQFITRAYRRGLTAALAELRAADVADPADVRALLRIPVHERQLQRLFTRNFGALEGMTEAVANQLRRTLSEGLASGAGPRDIARDLSDRIDAVGRTRASTIARTEVMHSHNSARSAEWQRQGVEQVGILLAPDACPQCQALKAGEPYPTEEAPGLLPQHPNCRCAIHIWTGGS